MIRKPVILRIFPAVSLALIVGVCPSPNQTKTKVVFVLFDLSGSTQLQEIRQRYYDNFVKVSDGMNPGDIILADAITDNPLAQSSFPVNDEFERFKPASENVLAHREKAKKKKEEILSTVKAILLNQTQKVSSTRILDALQLAERVFNTHKRDKKILVLFSDMVEESERYNFKRENLTERKIEQIISQEKAKGRLPDLSGVKVYVVGAAAGSYEKMPSEKMFSLQNFWLRYFKECGADLAKERYGGPLLEFK